MPDNNNSFFYIHPGDSPLITTAIHDGHRVREDLLDRYQIDAADRLREEDPFTARFAEVSTPRIIGRHSRFEVDLNRPRDKAVYRRPEDAWGLNVWKSPPTEAIVQESLRRYDAFYQAVGELLDGLVERYGCIVVYDIHTYNHRRNGPEAEVDDPQKNPDLNLGTGNLNRSLWGPLVDRFIELMRTAEFRSQPLDVRENIKFKGGYFSKWIHDRYGDRSCVLAIEFKKIFMDEWTGKAEQADIQLLQHALGSTVPEILAVRRQLCSQLSTPNRRSD